MNSLSLEKQVWAAHCLTILFIGLVEYLEKLSTFMDEIITSQTVTRESFSFLRAFSC